MGVFQTLTTHQSIMHHHDRRLVRGFIFTDPDRAVHPAAHASQAATSSNSRQRTRVVLGREPENQNVQHTMCIPLPIQSDECVLLMQTVCDSEVMVSSEGKLQTFRKNRESHSFSVRRTSCTWALNWTVGYLWPASVLRFPPIEFLFLRLALLLHSTCLTFH